MRRHLLPILLIALLSAAVYAPALKNGFVYDDPETVVNNAMIRDFNNLPKLFQSDYFVLSGEMSYRPVVTFTYFLDYALYGLRPWGFHLTNVLLHAINGALLYIFLTLFLRQAGDSPDSTPHTDGAVNPGQSPSVPIPRIFPSPLTGEGQGGGEFGCSFNGLQVSSPSPQSPPAGGGEVSGWTLNRDSPLSPGFQPTHLLDRCMGKMPVPPILNPPFLLSLLFVTHPVLTEAVNAVSFREDLLAFLFYIATLILYLILRQPTSAHWPPTTALLYLLSCATYSLALFSKEMAVSLPLTICCYELIYAKDNRGLRPVLFNLKNMGYVVVTIAYVYLRFSQLLNPDEAAFGFPEWSFGERVITFPWLFLNYLRLTLFPVSLSVDYMTPPLGSILSASFIISLAVFASVLTAALLSMKREKGISLGIFFFIITLAPVYNLVPVGHPVPLTERFLYLPAAGFAIALGLAISRAGARPLYLYALFVMLGIYIPATAMRSMLWKDNYTLWSDTVRKLPKNPFPHYALGLTCQKQGRLEEAKEHYETALRLRPGDPNAGDIYKNLGTIYDEQGQLDNAIEAYQAAVRLRPGEPMPHYNLGVIYAAQRRFDEAIQEFTTVLRLDPGFLEARHNLGVAYMERGALDRAREELETVLKLKPDFILSRKALESLKNRIK